jgi:hypothetical protein
MKIGLYIYLFKYKIFEMLIKWDLIVLVKSKAKVKDVIDNVKQTDLRYVMTLIDVYSRKADCRFLRDKKASSTLEALESMLEDMGKPKELQGDKGNEWEGVFRKYCKENNIKMVLKDRDGKFSNGIVERFNRTLIGYIKRYKTEFPKQGINQIASHLPEFIDNYNDNIHRTIGITPNEAFESNMINKNREGLNSYQRYKSSFKVGDYVRVRKEKTIFTKGRVSTYSKEVFKIVDKDANVYELNAPYDGKSEWSYNSLLKVELSPEDLEKYFKKPPRQDKVDKESESLPLRQSTRLLVKRRKETLRKKE